MSLLPNARGTHEGWPKWETIRYAIGDTGRTIRLCAIFLTIGIVGVLASIVPPFIMLLVHSWMG